MGGRKELSQRLFFRNKRGETRKVGVLVNILRPNIQIPNPQISWENDRLGTILCPRENNGDRWISRSLLIKMAIVLCGEASEILRTPLPLAQTKSLCLRNTICYDSFACLSFEQQQLQQSGYSLSPMAFRNVNFNKPCVTCERISL